MRLINIILYRIFIFIVLIALWLSLFILNTGELYSLILKLNCLFIPMIITTIMSIINTIMDIRFVKKQNMTLSIKQIYTNRNKTSKKINFIALVVMCTCIMAGISGSHFTTATNKVEILNTENFINVSENNASSFSNDGLLIKDKKKHMAFSGKLVVADENSELIFKENFVTLDNQKLPNDVRVKLEITYSKNIPLYLIDYFYSFVKRTYFKDRTLIFKELEDNVKYYIYNKDYKTGYDEIRETKTTIFMVKENKMLIVNLYVNDVETVKIDMEKSIESCFKFIREDTENTVDGSIS